MREDQYAVTSVLNKATEHYMVAETIDDADDCFVDAKERLLDINNWNKYCPLPGVAFSLTDGHGKPVNRKAHRGDHIKVEIPGVDGAHCCAMIESIEYDDYPDLGMEAFTLKLHSCEHSGEQEDNDDYGVVGAMIIERRYRHIYTAFQTTNAHDHSAAPDTLCGLTEAQWNSLARKFVY